MALEEIKNKIIPILRQSEVIRASIFGSRANYTSDKESDLDVLVEFRGEKSLLDLVELKLKLEDALGIKVDLLTYQSISPFLRDIIQKEELAIL